MKHGLLLVAAMFGLALAAPLHAQTPDERATARETVKKRGDAVVMVLATVKLRVNVGGRDQPSEIATQANATVLDGTGLTVLSLSSLQPDEAYQRQLSRSVPPGTRTEVTSEATEIRIRTADGRELPARLVLRDQDLDLAFVRPTEAPAVPMPFVDAVSARPSLLDPVVILQRTNESLGWVISAALGSVQVTLDKPRTYYLISFASMGGQGLGSPIFDMTGRFLGVILLRDTGMRGSTAPGLLPADDIRDVAKQAK
jgi:S1-C subfamily serine protease